MRVMAIDWSGAAPGGANSIWIAEVVDGEIARLQNGRSRDRVCDLLLDEARRDPSLIVGIDFAFSLPAWFLEQQGIGSASELWLHMAVEADEWLAPKPPFWRVTKTSSGLTPEREFRRTDREFAAVAGVRAESVFKLVGSSQVGAASLRGMPTLSRLARAGFSIWPFQVEGLPLVVEIYPRLLTGPVVKSDFAARRLYLRSMDGLGDEFRDTAAGVPDAFDAAVSALRMWDHRNELIALEAEADYALEGRIWAPAETV